MRITIPAYAKINLFLDIVSAREDKYHNILTLMQSVDLHDLISIEFTECEEKSISLTCSNPSLPIDSNNLVYKAAELFPINGSIGITVEKNIPVSAGLAGGSTDAAATLVALNKLTGSKFNSNELKSLGKRLGADVPFCIDGGAAVVEGIGDIIHPCASMPRFPIVIARLGEGMSTPAAYRMLDEKYEGFGNYTPKKAMLDHLMCDRTRQNPSAYCEGIYNIFESVVEPLRPDVSKVKEIMIDCGAAGSMMSGSGTSVFGIFAAEAEASTAFQRLTQIGAEAHLCYPTE